MELERYRIYSEIARGIRKPFLVFKNANVFMAHSGEFCKIITERQQKRYKPRKCLCFLGFSYVQRFKGHHKKVQISDGN